MSDIAFTTAQLNDWVERVRVNDPKSRDELARAICLRVERLGRKMLRGFENIRRDADTLDVAQGALMRIMSSLEKSGWQFESTRQFMAFAATCIRSELLDLARRCGSAKRGGGKIISMTGESSDGLVGEPAADQADEDQLELWTRFHEKIQELPAKEREVIGLKFYHGWAEKEIADLFGVSDRTVRRWWVSACVRLEKDLGGEMPQT